MDNHSLWKLAGEAEAAIATTYGPLFEAFGRERGLEAPVVGLLLAALTFEPEATSPARLLVRGPYTAAGAYRARLAAAADKGCLIEVAPDAFRLTVTGRAQVEHLVAAGRAAMAAADPLAAPDSERLAALLGRLVRASLETPPPPDTWSIALACKLLPAARPPLPYTEQAISCLNGYRDDAHLAAWQPCGLSAVALEALTLLWRGEVDSLDALCQRLRRREHAVEAYSRALQELRVRGWLTGLDTAPRLTSVGTTGRDEIERATDGYFFAPWRCLSDDERAELGGLLSRLRVELRSNPAVT
jgi:hypothetical protein